MLDERDPLSHFFIICISNIAIKLKYPLTPETMLIWKVIVPVFQQSHGSSHHPNFVTTKRHCSEGEGERERGGDRKTRQIGQRCSKTLAGIVAPNKLRDNRNENILSVTHSFCHWIPWFWWAWYQNIKRRKRPGHVN